VDVKARSLTIVGSVVLVSLVGGCRIQQQSGAVVGVGAGALAGAALAHGNAGGAILGGILGALLGAEVGRQMDALDERQMSRAPTRRCVG